MKLRFPTAAPRAAGLVVLVLVSVSVPAARAETSLSVPSGAAVAPAWPALDAALARDPGLRPVYAARGFAPIWADMDGNATPARRALLAAIEAASDHALPAARYDAARRAAARPGWDAERELAFSQAAVAYAQDMAAGATVPREIDRDIAIRPQRPDRATLLEGMAAADSATAFLNGLLPKDDDYMALVERLSEMRRLATIPGVWGPSVPGGPALKLGSRDPRVGALRARLGALGDLAAEGPVDARGSAEVVLAANDVTLDTGALPIAATSDPLRYDESVEAAVRRFQRRHGLNDDGVVGPATLEQLNASPAFRADQIAVNLERMRWLHRDTEARHIVVNIPAFRMKVMEAGRPVFESRVVVGTRRHQTPEFSDLMDHMVINPTWFVPKSIAVNEILPKLREDPGYLESNNMRLAGADADPWEIDWTEVTPSTFPGSVRQRPGPGNALGRVKFMFPNDFAIYLHDTPQRHLFARDVRAYSHGCVRVEKPLELAHFLLEGQVNDPAAAFAGWLDSGRERYVNLDRPIPVHITYRTAWQDDDGVAQFRGDIYGRDEAVMSALRAAGAELSSI